MNHPLIDDAKEECYAMHAELDSLTMLLGTDNEVSYINRCISDSVIRLARHLRGLEQIASYLAKAEDINQ